MGFCVTGVPLSPDDGVPGGLLPAPVSPLGAGASVGVPPVVWAAGGEVSKSVVIAAATGAFQVTVISLEWRTTGQVCNPRARGLRTIQGVMKTAA